MSYWKELGNNDIVGKLEKLLDSGAFYIDKDTLKIKRHEKMYHNQGWIHVRRAPWMNCTLWHHVYFQTLRAIHSGCFACYKVMARPTTVKDLFIMYEVMKELDLPSKCGIDTREYVRELYGGVWYAQTVEEGQEVYEKVKKAIAKSAAPDIPLLLKRGCTEFEIMFGDSSKFVQKDEDKKWERIVEEVVDVPEWHGTQPDYLKRHIERLWLAWAYRHNDITCREFNDGEDFITPATTYHKPIEGIANG